jgi:FkbM family methyltransferase
VDYCIGRVVLIDFENALKEYGVEPRGIIHIGAHYGQEIKVYDKCKVGSVLFFEPLLKNFVKLKQNVGTKDNIKLENLALGNSVGEIEMYVEEENEGQSSSILKPMLHKQQYPHIKFTKKEKVKITSLNQYGKNNDLSQYNIIVIDVQGYELSVFKGATDFLANIDLIVTEVNRAELYENATRVVDLDAFLSKSGFKRVFTNWEGQTWGDAIYVKGGGTQLVNLFDKNFLHAKAQLGFDCAGIKKPKKIKWVRNNIEWDGITVFTDEKCYSNFVDQTTCKIKVAWLMESPALKPRIYMSINKIAHKFDYIFSNVKLSFLNDEHKMVVFPMAGAWVDPISENHPKNKKISAIFSPKNYLPGHKIRKQIEERLKNKKMVDFYGKEHKFIENKSEGLYDYMFSIAVENARADDFFTEKVVDCFLSKTIPIYYGPSNMGEYFNNDGIITFNTVEELNQTLNEIDREMYMKKIVAVEENFQKALKYQIPDDRLIEEINRRENND